MGYTENLTRRLRAHKTGTCWSTRMHRPIMLIHVEYFLAKTDALRREAILKTPRGKALLFLLAESIEIVQTKSRRYFPEYN